MCVYANNADPNTHLIPPKTQPPPQHPPTGGPPAGAAAAGGAGELGLALGVVPPDGRLGDGLGAGPVGGVWGGG